MKKYTTLCIIILSILMISGCKESAQDRGVIQEIEDMDINQQIKDMDINQQIADIELIDEEIESTDSGNEEVESTDSGNEEVESTGSGNEKVESTKVDNSGPSQSEKSISASNIDSSNSSEKIINKYGDLIDVQITKNKALDLSRKAQSNFFNLEIDETYNYSVELNGGYSVVDPYWIISDLKKEEAYTCTMIDANSGDLIFATYKFFNTENNDEENIDLENAKEISINFLVDHEMIKSDSDVNYIGFGSEYGSDKAWALEFEQIGTEQIVYLVAVEKSNAQISMFSKRKIYTQKEEEEIKEYLSKKK